MKKIVVVSFLLLAIFSLNAYCIQDKIHGKWWKNPKIVQELELTGNQIERIEKIFLSKKPMFKKTYIKLKEKESLLKKSLNNPNSSRQEVLQLNDEVDHLRGTLKRMKLDMRLQIRDILTETQKIKLRQIKTKHKEHPHP